MKKILMASALAALMGGASAQVYVGGAFGASQTSVDCGEWPQCDKNDTGFKLYGGYQVHPAIAVELGYIDFGAAKVSGSDAYAGYTGRAEDKFTATAFTLAAAGRLAFTPTLTGVARLGVANVKAEENYSEVVRYNGAVVDSYSESKSETKLKPYFGLGLEFSFNKALRGSLGADFTKGEVNGQTGDVRLFTLGLQYGF